MARQIFSLILIFTLSLFLSGCNSKQEKTVIQFASWGSQSEIKILKPILENYEKQNPNIKIDFLHIPQNYFEKIHLLFASNTAPDVIFINNQNIPIYENYLEDLSSYFDFTQFFEQATSTLSYNDKIYAVPRDVSTLVIYYNKNLFDEYNVSYPNSNWTFEEFLTIAKTLSHKGVWGIGFEKDALYYLPYLMSEGGGILAEDLKTLLINTPNSKKALQFYADLRNKYHVAPKNYESASATMTQLFLQEKIAMQLSGRWLVPKYRESATFNWDVNPFPKGTQGSIVPLDASGWALNKFSKNKTEAIKFIKYLSTKENIEKFTSSGLITPARVDVANSEIFLAPEKLPKSSHIFLDVIETSKKTPVSKDYKQILDKLDLQLEPLFNP